MKCIISGVETKNKWRNIPVEKVFVSAAKALMGDYGLTMRQALKRIDKEYFKTLKKKMEEADAIALYKEQENTEVR